MNSIIYIGAFTDIKLIINKHFKNYDIIFVDSQPVSEYDIPYKKWFYRHYFLIDLIEQYNYLNFKLLSEEKIKTIKKLEAKPICQKIEYFEPHLLKFKNKNKISKYYISSAFPTRLSYHLKRDLLKSNKLFISGFFPSVEILKHMSIPISLYCYYDTVYKKSNNKKTNIIDFLYDKNWKKYIDNIIFVSHKDELIKCRDVQELNNYCKLANLIME